MRAIEMCLVFVIFISLAAAVVIKLIPDKKLQPLPKREPIETYGHPWSPVATLRNRLPKLRPGLAWETKVGYEVDGDTRLTLTLVDLGIGAETRDLASKSFSLTYYRKNERYSENVTFAARYRESPTIKDHTFNNDVVGPMTDWATTEEAKLHSGETTDYKLS